MLFINAIYLTDIDASQFFITIDDVVYYEVEGGFEAIGKIFFPREV